MANSRAPKISNAAGIRKNTDKVNMPKKHGDNSMATMGGKKSMCGTKGM